MLEIIDRYGHVHNCREVNVVIVARRLSIADSRWWRVDTRTGPFFFDNAVGYNYPPPPCISYALVQATVGVGTVIIVYVILITCEM